MVKGCPIWVAWAGSVTFQNQTVPSPPPAARVWPCGLNATEPTPSLVGPVRGCPTWVARAGSVTFHSQILRSLAPAARVCPSGLNATE